jgi:hypothetical protein
LLKRHRFSDVVIAAHYLPEQIQSYFGDGRQRGMTLHYSVEELLLGTAGSVKHAQPYLGDEPFLVISGDIVTDINLSHVVQFHQEKDALATLVLTRVADSTQYGVVVTDPAGDRSAHHPQVLFATRDRGDGVEVRKRKTKHNEPTIAIARARTMQLLEQGQALWLDSIQRGRLVSGELTQLIEEDGLRGETANPTLFEHALNAPAGAYDESLRELTHQGLDANAIYERIATDDVRMACDLFRPLYDRLDGADGFVSLEVMCERRYVRKETHK